MCLTIQRLLWGPISVSSCKLVLISHTYAFKFIIYNGQQLAARGPEIEIMWVSMKAATNMMTNSKCLITSDELGKANKTKFVNSELDPLQFAYMQGGKCV